MTTPSTSSAPAPLPRLPLIQRLSPRVLRLLGDNPSKFTLQGSNTYLVGSGPRRFLIDTGEGGRKAWTEALEKVLRDEGITGIEAVLLTHWHPDHVGGVGDVRGVCGRVFGKGDGGGGGGGGGGGDEVRVFKNQSRPGKEGERGIEDGQVFRTAEGSTTLRAFYCPGHAVDHMAFVLEEEGAVFTGDNVLGHGTAVFEDLAAYMRSLEGMVGLFGQDRTSKHIGILDAAPVYERLPGFQVPEGHLRCCVYSPDGRFFAWASPEKVSVVDASVGHLVTELHADNVYELGFSPLGTYIITWQRPSKDEEGNATKNLKVWKTIDEAVAQGGTRDVIGQFVQKQQTGWNLQYTADEAFCARCVTNEVQFYEATNLAQPWNRLRVEGATDFALAGNEKHSVAIFTPERKGQPASVKVFNVPHFNAPVSQKTFFKGDKVQLKWNNQGTSLIVLAQTDVDKSNKSYYGETTMYILSANGGFDSRIQLDKEGPIHDVSWSPNSKEFGVVYGYMPAKTTIFNARAIPQHSFNLGPRNTIIFSPHGRFVIVAGFGNLAGTMDIYDLEKNYDKVATIEASNSSICEWSPDGRHILTATTSPRLRVDNGIKIWHVGGGLMYKEDFQELYHVVWRPLSTTHLPLTGDPVKEMPAPHASAKDYLATVKTPSKPAGAYRPPGARGQATPLNFKREDEGGAAFVREMMSGKAPESNGFGPSAASRRRAVPGAEKIDGAAGGDRAAAPGSAAAANAQAADGDENLSKAALKNKKKREAKKAKEAEAKSQGLTVDGEGMNGNATPAGQNGRSPERKDRPRSRSKSNYEAPRPSSRRRDGSRQRGPPGGPPALHTNNAQTSGNKKAPGGGPPAQNKSSAPAAQAPPAQAPELTVTSPGNGTSEEKKIRSLLKKLRAIDDLKMRQAGGEKLEGTQVLKIGTEEQVRKELGGLGYSE
ncbi:hypothetical protein BTJ68_03047 [Hortaea werneckii EXF-2000]|uniref:Eukaryotic translation initiation factor 2A n=1 Tax=Hortaea werneckii EXF-2000 TaxID=1157616 RepID=A0A1Z5TMS1_HORWE|nr:hypothetical protein BTJ68_03047 [Hortaea werneckii EXF-2000]